MNELVAIELADDERAALSRGLPEWRGLGTEELAVAMGFLGRDWSITHFGRGDVQDPAVVATSDRKRAPRSTPSSR
ncbi:MULTISPECIES: hypothetical protein [Amycolatopsis]|uniref:Uncharacterized protein n=1 Tax=Amycolatopsis albidoflavus TaxID=102226 RepID=A0ABW5HQ10_9PSEU